MLPKTNRLAKKKDFQVIFKKGRRIEGRLVWVKFLKNDLGPARAGFVVGTKISKKATERNRIKRRLRDVFKKHSIGIEGYDFIVGAKPAIIKKSFSEVDRELAALLEKTQ